VADQLARHDTLVDVDDIVTETSTVRVTRQVAADHAEPVRIRRDRNRHVQPQQVSLRWAGVVQPRDTGERDGHEVVAIGLLERAELRVQLVQEAARIGVLEYCANWLSSIGLVAFHLSFRSVGISTSLMSGLPRRETWVKPPSGVGRSVFA